MHLFESQPNGILKETQKTRDRRTPLYVAAESGHANVVQTLLRGGRHLSCVRRCRGLTHRALVGPLFTLALPWRRGRAALRRARAVLIAPPVAVVVALSVAAVVTPVVVTTVVIAIIAIVVSIVIVIVIVIMIVLVIIIVLLSPSS